MVAQTCCFFFQVIFGFLQLEDTSSLWCFCNDVVLMYAKFIGCLTKNALLPEAKI